MSGSNDIDHVDYLAIVCGKKYILNLWAEFISQLPVDEHPGNLIVMNNSTDPEYQSLLFEKLSKEPIRSMFNTVSVVYGPGKFIPPDGVSWRDPEVNVGKHNSTSDALNIGFTRCTSELIVTIDDDTFTHPGGLSKLIKHIKGQEHVGAVSGVYLTKPWSDEITPRYMTDRTVVMSIEQERWIPVQIDQVYQRGVMEIGYCGTGGVVWRRDAVNKSLPTYTETTTNRGCTLGPDGVLCRSIRDHGYKILADTSVLAEHYGKNDTGEPYAVGMTTSNIIEQYSKDIDLLLFTSFSENIEDREQTIQSLIGPSHKLKAQMMMWWIDSIKLPDDFENKYPMVTFKIIPPDDYLKYAEREPRVLEKGYRTPWLRVMFYDELNSGKYRKIISMLPFDRYNRNREEFYSDDNFDYYQKKFPELYDKQLSKQGIL